MTLSDLAVLPPQARAEVAADRSVGGGNVIRSAVAASPRPDVPFLRSAQPLVNTAGDLQTEFSLNQVAELVDSWSAWYLHRGVRPRDRVAVFLDDSFAYSLHFHALAQIGAVGVLINSNAPRHIAAGLVEETHCVGISTDRERIDRLDDTIAGLPSLQWLHLTEEMPAPPVAELPDNARFQHADEDPVVLLHSSGTTGIPKAVIHTHRSIVAGPQFRLADHTETPGALMMTALPQSHLGCIAYTNYAILAGTPIVAVRDLVAADLQSALQRYRPTSVMAFGHAYSELAALDLAAGAVDSVDVWVSIGDAVHFRHIKKILGVRSPDRPAAAFYDRLGTTELGWGVLLQIRTSDSERNDRCGGKPVGVADVAVLRQDGTEADADEYGLLGARGPAITPGYWDNSDTTYRTKLAGYWLTGDVAYRDEEGRFFQVDRSLDAIDTGDGKAYSVLMEEILLSDVPDIADCTVVAGRYGNQTVPVAVVKLHDNSRDVKSLLNAANEVLRRSGQPELAVLETALGIEDFPVGVTGKVLKRQLREKYQCLPSPADPRNGRTFAMMLR
jgi:acyl-coenzyme A synthetase/AMP-(fatty) acid ligase